MGIELLIISPMMKVSKKAPAIAPFLARQLLLSLLKVSNRMNNINYPSGGRRCL